jgi:aryl-alcohol dehydrogenase-like predicted oxidoreductase
MATFSLRPSAGCPRERERERERERFLQVLEKAYELGVTHFDTAKIYAGKNRWARTGTTRRSSASS